MTGAKNILRILSLILLPCLIFGCTDNDSTESNTTTDDGKSEPATYQNITAEEAKRIMDESEDPFVILDVRTLEEYNEGHIKDAILIPYDEIEAKASEMLPDKDILILVYCRSGRRSKIAAETLLDMGYTSIKEFGGIIDWSYGTVTE